MSSMIHDMVRSKMGYIKKTPKTMARARKRAKRPPSDDEEIDVHDVEPFDIVPPPPQPAARQRKGTGYIHPNLPQLPFTVALVGPRKTGKSVTLRNLLDPSRDGSYGSAFKSSNIVFYSPTMNYDKTIVSLNLKNTYGPPTSVPALYDNIKEQQESYRLQDDMADVLLVLEDCTNIQDAWPVVTKLGYTGRHFGIHTAVVAHKLTSIPRANRTQIQQWMLFRPHEESEREWVLYMFTRKATRDIWLRAFHRAWTLQDYNFVYIDFERSGMRNIYRDGLNEPLLTDEEITMIENIEMGLGPKLPTEEATTVFPPETIGSSGKNKRSRKMDTHDKSQVKSVQPPKRRKPK
jgi:hypothetical protein